MRLSEFIKARISRRLQVGFILIALLVTALTIFSYLQINNSAKTTNSVNLATQQYLLLKQIVLQQSLLIVSVEQNNQQKRQKQLSELNNAIDSLEKNRLDSLDAYVSVPLPIDKMTSQFITNSRIFVQDFKLGKAPSSYVSEAAIADLIDSLNQFVLKLELEASKNHSFVIQLQWLFLLSTIVLLFVLFLFILKPVEILIDRAINRLHRSIKAAKADNATDNIQNQFLTNHRHELRTHISSMFGMVELAKEEPNKDKQSNLLQKAQKSGEQLLLLIDNLLDVSRIEEDKLKIENTDFELPKLLDSCLSPIAVICEKNGIAFSYEALSPLPTMVVGDSLHLGQVINNLLENSVKFTPFGNIRVTSDLRVENKQLMFEFTIEDTGIGIDENNIDRIFDKFTQLKNNQTRIFNGLGLGLTLAKALIEKMKGTITVRSAIGKGTLFKFSVPLSKSDSSGNTKLASVGKKHQGIKFAVVDDLETSRDYMAMILKNEGHEVDTFNSGADILRMTAKVKQYSVIVIDVHMPGLSGYELADILQAMYGDSCPAIIFISASIESLNERQGEYNTTSKAFAKPINKDRFIDAVHIVVSDNNAPVAVKQKLKVLVVEDEPISAEIVQTMLGKMGHQVFYASTAKEAVDMAVNKDIDIILMDINLPDFSGIEATKIILNEYKIDVPIIALTANTYEEDRLATKEAGMRHHLIKPVHFDELEDVVHSTTLK